MNPPHPVKNYYIKREVIMNINIVKKIIISAICLTIFTSCNKDYKGAVMVNLEKTTKLLENIHQEKWDILAKKKIYFGHKSVGADIMNGIEIVASNNSAINLKIQETTDSASFDKPIWGHSKIGINTKPESKINAFSDILNQGLGDKLDIAFMKLCYVDVTKDTDINTLFENYSQTIKLLEKKYPKIKFIHLTVPLTSYKKRNFKEQIKDIIKKVIGRKTLKEIHIENNIMREKYNTLLRNHYKKDKLFDLAFYESVYKDDIQEKCKKNGKEYPCLIPHFTYDGGHLNMTGKKAVASNLLLFLSKLY